MIFGLYWWIYELPHEGLYNIECEDNDSKWVAHIGVCFCGSCNNEIGIDVQRLASLRNLYLLYIGFPILWYFLVFKIMWYKSQNKQTNDI